MEFIIAKYNITKIYNDAVVLPANKRLTEGPGVSTHIFEQAGRVKLTAACHKIGSCELGMSVITPGFDFGTQYIVHSVVPRWIDGEHHEYELLSSSYLSALYVADQAGCESITFPLLASGNNGFDFKIAYEVAKKSITSFEPSNNLKTVLLLVYSENAVKAVQSFGDYVELSPASLQIKGINMTDPYKKKEPGFFDKLANAGRKLFSNAAEDAVDFGINQAELWIKNPENQKMLIQKGAEVFGMVVRAVL